LRCRRCLPQATPAPCHDALLATRCFRRFAAAASRAAFRRHCISRLRFHAAADFAPPCCAIRASMLRCCSSVDARWRSDAMRRAMPRCHAPSAARASAPRYARRACQLRQHAAMLLRCRFMLPRSRDAAAPALCGAFARRERDISAAIDAIGHATLIRR